MQLKKKLLFPCSVYVDSLNSLEIYLKSGVSKIILEDPHYSILCRSKKENQINLINLEILIRRILQEKEDIQMVFNIDGVFHNKDFKPLNFLFDFLSQTACKRIRIQDYGLAYWIIKNYPQFELEFYHFTGNKNWEAIKALENYWPENLKGHIFSSEIQYEALKTIQLKSNLSNELLIHGPILLFYTKRKLLASIPESDRLKNAYGYYESFLKEKKRPNDWFWFLNNHHGSFLFLHQLLALIKHIEKLKSLHFSYWLIDLRGADADWIFKCLSMYENAFSNACEESVEKDIQVMEAYYNQKLTEGFFLEDLTDFSSNKKVKQDEILIESNEIPELSSKESLVFEKVARIIDINQNKIALEVYKFFSKEDLLCLEDIKKKKHFFSFQHISNLNGESLSSTKDNRWVICNFVKGVVNQNFIYRSKNVNHALKAE